MLYSISSASEEGIIQSDKKFELFKENKITQIYVVDKNPVTLLLYNQVCFNIIPY